MLYWLSYALEDHFGPFRLLRSHALLLSFGTFLAAFLTWYALPKLWHLMPHDHGKAILGKVNDFDAYVVKANGEVVKMPVSTGDLTDDERQIIADGCLINYYRNH